MLRRSLVLLAVVAPLSSLAGLAAAAQVDVRVEGKTQTIFGADEPRSSARTRWTRSTPAARWPSSTPTSRALVRPVRRPGRLLPRRRPTGWVFKVNGVSPPVGADQVQLKDGDTVLWYFAQFGADRRPADARSLEPIERAATARRRRTTRAWRQVPPASSSTSARRPCPHRRDASVRGSPHGLVWASAPGAVRSNRAAVIRRASPRCRRRTLAGCGGAAPARRRSG